jgi:hypothetical protein
LGTRERGVAVKRRSSRLLTAVSLTILLIAGLLVGATASGAAPPVEPIDCPEVMTMEEIQALPDGTPGVGFTVSKGTEPEIFDVEVVGVLEHAIGPGRHMIIIEASNAAIDAKGIWFGMSGSPVYVDDKLIGAVAYGLSWGPSSVAGLTPAEDMAGIPGFPEASASRSQPRWVAGARKARLTDGMRREIARTTSTSIDEVGGTMRRLKVPFGVSGVSSARFDRVARAIKRSGLELAPYLGSTGALASEAGGTVGAGDSFAGSLSYGDIGFSGVGTTSMVCDGTAVAFGHPFLWAGNVTMGINTAKALMVVPDAIGGSYKLATIGAGVGTLTQDRLAGIVGTHGDMPELIPISSRVTALDTGVQRDGETEVTMSDFVSYLTFVHLFTNIDVTFDQIGRGSSELAWTIRGTREDGGTWTLAHSNMYADDYDISFGSIYELLSQLSMIESNEFEDVEFSEVNISASVREQVRRFRLVKVLSSTNGRWFRDVSRIAARPGSQIYLRALLRQRGDSTLRRANLVVRVPQRGHYATIEISGSGGEDFYFEEEFYGGYEEEGPSGPSSLDELINLLERSPKNNVLTAKLRRGSGRVASIDAKALSRVVQGSDFVEVIVRR